MYSDSPSQSTQFDDLIDPERAKILDNADAFLEQLEREEEEARNERFRIRQLSKMSNSIPIPRIDNHSPSLHSSKTSDTLPVVIIDSHSPSQSTNPSPSNQSSKDNFETHVQNTHLEQTSSARSSTISEKIDIYGLLSPDVFSPVSLESSVVSYDGPGIGLLDPNSLASPAKSRDRTASDSVDVSESITCSVPESPPPDAQSYSSEVEHAIPDSPPPERNSPSMEPTPGLLLTFDQSEMEIPDDIAFETEISRKRGPEPPNHLLTSPVEEKKGRFIQHQKDTPSFDRRFIMHQKDSPSFDRSVSRSRARMSASVIRHRPVVGTYDNRRATMPARRFVPARLVTSVATQTPGRENVQHLMQHIDAGEEEIISADDEEPESPPLTPVGNQHKTAGMIGWNQTFPKSTMSVAAASTQHPSITRKIHEGISLSTTRKNIHQQSTVPPVWGSMQEIKRSPDSHLEDFKETPDITITPIPNTTVRTSIYNFEGLRLRRKYMEGDPVEVEIDEEWELCHVKCFNLDDNTWSVKLFDSDDCIRVSDAKVRQPLIDSNIQRLEDRENRSETPESRYEDEYDRFDEGIELDSEIQKLQSLSPPNAIRPRVVSVSSTFDFSHKHFKPSPSPGIPGESFDFGSPPSVKISPVSDLEFFPRKESADTIFSSEAPTPTHTPPPPDEPIPVRMLEQFRKWEFDYRKAQEDVEPSSNYFPEIVDGSDKDEASRSLEDSISLDAMTDVSFAIDPPDSIGLFGAPPRASIVDDEQVAKLIAMDFTSREASVALDMSNGDFDFALALLLSEKDAKAAQKAEQEENDEKLAIDMQSVEYEVTFKGERFGFEILLGANGRGAKVGILISKFSKLNIVPGSTLNEVASVGVESKSLEEIRMLMLAQMHDNGGCSIKFGTTAKAFNNFKTRGTLKVLVLGGEALYVPASYCTISVLEAELGTDRVKRTKNPVWNNMLVWYKYGVREECNAVVRIWRYNRFLPNKCVGEGYFQIPDEPDRAKESAVQMKNKKGEIIGVIVLKTIIQTNNLSDRRWLAKK